MVNCPPKPDLMGFIMTKTPHFIHFDINIYLCRFFGFYFFKEIFIHLFREIFCFFLNSRNSILRNFEDSARISHAGTVHCHLCHLFFYSGIAGIFFIFQLKYFTAAFIVAAFEFLFTGTAFSILSNFYGITAINQFGMGCGQNEL